MAAEATGTLVRVLFLTALEAEGLLTDELTDRLATLDDTAPLDDLAEVPLLLAVSDNGTEMHCRETRRFLAVCSIAQHFGRPSTPTDQTWIETLWGHVKYEHPHLMAITDPAVLAAELERVRVEYNAVRLHEAIGYVTPNDVHEGRGDAIARLAATPRAGPPQAPPLASHTPELAMTATALTATTRPCSITTNQPPAPRPCGLIPPTTCRVKSETAHYFVVRADLKWSR